MTTCTVTVVPVSRVNLTRLSVGRVTLGEVGISCSLQENSDRNHSECHENLTLDGARSETMRPVTRLQK